MKDHLLCLLLVTAAVITAYGQDACNDAREYDMNKIDECYAYFTAHNCALNSFFQILPSKKI